jgi:hypothetical protein
MGEKSKVLILVFISQIFNSCDGLYQNDHIYYSSTVGEIEGKNIVYDIYQTGIDNYRYEIYILGYRDTTRLFLAYLNDAIADNSQFDLHVTNSKIEIKCNKSIGYQEKLINGKTFVLAGIDCK